jgi:hypothetical protein
MKIATLALAAIDAAILLAHPAQAQQQQRIPVCVSSSAPEDATVSHELFSDVLDDLARSPRYRQATCGTAGMLVLTMLATDDSPRHEETACSDMLFRNGHLITASIVIVGADHLDETARRIISDLDDANNK